MLAPGVMGAAEQYTYLIGLLGKAKYKRDTAVTIDERIVLLSTCSAESTNGRDILVGRITDEPYENPFALEDTGDTGATVDTQSEWWARVPEWARMPLAALLILLTGIAIGYAWGKRRRGSD